MTYGSHMPKIITAEVIVDTIHETGQISKHLDWLFPQSKKFNCFAFKSCRIATERCLHILFGLGYNTPICYFNGVQIN